MKLKAAIEILKELKDQIDEFIKEVDYLVDEIADFKQRILDCATTENFQMMASNVEKLNKLEEKHHYLSLLAYKALFNIHK